mmetsp:Transcript_56649/g.120289  ORF Transcript_56649/g.120289 Transcript_56649/m.120289 type:complete len:291 (-) Transcript_56649:1558-2430(-)
MPRSRQRDVDPPIVRQESGRAPNARPRRRPHEGQYDHVGLAPLAGVHGGDEHPPEAPPGEEASEQGRLSLVEGDDAQPVGGVPVRDPSGRAPPYFLHEIDHGRAFRLVRVGSSVHLTFSAADVDEGVWAHPRQCDIALVRRASHVLSVRDPAVVELAAREGADLRVHSILAVQHEERLPAPVHQPLVHRGAQAHVRRAAAHDRRGQLEGISHGEHPLGPQVEGDANFRLRRGRRLVDQQIVDPPRPLERRRPGRAERAEDDAGGRQQLRHRRFHPVEGFRQIVGATDGLL